jgi:hypothetical protein
MNPRLTAAAVGIALTLAGGGIAHATQNAPVAITMTTTSCDSTHHISHETLTNGTTTDEKVQVYLEPSGGGNTLGVPVTNAQALPAPVTVAHDANLAITLPYETSDAVFMAVAVETGAALPTTDQELTTQREAGTASYAELHAPCNPAPPNPCPTDQPNPYPIPASCPTFAATVAPKPATSTTPKATPTVTRLTMTPAARPTTTAAIIPVAPVSTTAPTATPVSVTAPTATTTTAAIMTAPAAATTRTTRSPLTVIVAALLVALVGVACVMAGSRKSHRRG